jgi:hypothetical protein
MSLNAKVDVKMDNLYAKEIGIKDLVDYLYIVKSRYHGSLWLNRKKQGFPFAQ